VKFCVCFRRSVLYRVLSGGTSLLVLPLSFVVDNVVRICSGAKCGSYLCGKTAEMFFVQYIYNVSPVVFCSSMESPCPTPRN
jgi:hypothetical protein